VIGDRVIRFTTAAVVCAVAAFAAMVSYSLIYGLGRRAAGRSWPPQTVARPGSYQTIVDHPGRPILSWSGRLARCCRHAWTNPVCPRLMYRKIAQWFGSGIVPQEQQRFQISSRRALAEEAGI
jgi:hypothetical protein